MSELALSVAPSPLAMATPAAGATRATLGALAALLATQASLLSSIDDDDYAAAPVRLPGLTSGIGVHVRHCLDHGQALLAGLTEGTVYYDRRQRHTPVERDRGLAQVQVAGLAAALRALDPDQGDRPLVVESVVTRDGTTVRSASTFGRELVFVLSHTVHHHALIGVLACHWGHPLPPEFALAPATVAWQQGH